MIDPNRPRGLRSELLNERCHGLSRQRRCRFDYEPLASTLKIVIYLVGVRLLLARLAPAEK
jgi:hypothetical protein